MKLINQMILSAIASQFLLPEDLFLDRTDPEQTQLYLFTGTELVLVPRWISQATIELMQVNSTVGFHTPGELPTVVAA